jgi:hypothetical protein
MPRYFIRFKVNSRNGDASEYTRSINLEYPIEYDSDIKEVQEWVAQQVDADASILVEWKELKGAVRPTHPTVVSSAGGERG